MAPTTRTFPPDTVIPMHCSTNGGGCCNNSERFGWCFPFLRVNGEEEVLQYKVEVYNIAVLLPECCFAPPSPRNLLGHRSQFYQSFPPSFGQLSQFSPDLSHFHSIFVNFPQFSVNFSQYESILAHLDQFSSGHARPKPMNFLTPGRAKQHTILQSNGCGVSEILRNRTGTGNRNRRNRFPRNRTRNRNRPNRFQEPKPEPSSL